MGVVFVGGEVCVSGRVMVGRDGAAGVRMEGVGDQTPRQSFPGYGLGKG